MHEMRYGDARLACRLAVTSSRRLREGLSRLDGLALHDLHVDDVACDRRAQFHLPVGGHQALEHGGGRGWHCDHENERMDEWVKERHRRILGAWGPEYLALDLCRTCERSRAVLPPGSGC